MAVVSWGQAGDGADAATMPVLVSPHQAGHQNALALPGVAGNYASQPDVNLLDADTAHFEQSIGTWINGGNVTNITTVTNASSEFGSKSAQFEATASTQYTYLRTPSGASTDYLITGGNTYTVGVFVRGVGNTRNAQVYLQTTDASHSLVDNVASGFVALDSAGQWMTRTVTTGATATRVSIVFDVQHAVAGELFQVDAAFIRQGSDPTFLPSTRITGDIDLRAHVQPQEWGGGAEQAIVGKYLSSGGNRSYYLATSSTGTVTLFWSEDGTAASIANSTSSVPFPDGAAGWVRATLDVSTGDSTFYTSTDGGSWTQLGTTVAGSATSIFVGTAVVAFGQAEAGVSMLHGALYSTEVRDGIDGPVVARLDPDDLEAGNENLLDANTAFLANGTGQWAVNSNADGIALSSAEAPVYGANHLTWNAIANGDSNIRTTSFTSIVGNDYAASARVRCASGISRDMIISILWRDASDAYLAQTNGATVGVDDSGWATVSVTGTAPASAVKMRILVQAFSTLAGEDFYVDAICFREGTDTDFTFPNGSGVDTLTGHTIATFRTGDATAECVDRPCWMFTGAEWLQIADRDALDFGTGDFTVAVGVSGRWSAATDARIVDKGGGTGARFALFYDNATSIRWYMEDETVKAVSSSLSQSDGTWDTVLGWREGDTSYARSDASTDSDALPSGFNSVTNADDLMIGAVDTGPGQALKGLLSWVAVWNRALTASERSQVAAWDGSPARAPTCIYESVLYLSAADQTTQDSYPATVINTLSALLYPNMGSATRRARQRYVFANAGSKLWEIDA